MEVYLKKEIYKAIGKFCGSTSGNICYFDPVKYKGKRGCDKLDCTNISFTKVTESEYLKSKNKL